jgi:hypothetical protein
LFSVIVELLNKMERPSFVKTMKMSDITRSDKSRGVQLIQANGKLSPSNHHSSKPSFSSTNIYANSITSNDLKKIGAMTPDMKDAANPHSYRDYGLQGWRAYALMKFGDHEKFQKSPHGRNIIVANALREYSRETRVLVEWADEVERTAREINEELTVERARRIKAEERVVELENTIREIARPSPRRQPVEMLHSSNYGFFSRNSEKGSQSGNSVSPKKSMMSPWMSKRFSPQVNQNEHKDLEEIEKELNVTSPSLERGRTPSPLKTIGEYDRNLRAASPRGTRSNKNGSGNKTTTASSTPSSSGAPKRRKSGGGGGIMSSVFAMMKGKTEKSEKTEKTEPPSPSPSAPASSAKSPSSTTTKSLDHILTSSVTCKASTTTSPTHKHDHNTGADTPPPAAPSHTSHGHHSRYYQHKNSTPPAASSSSTDMSSITAKPGTSNESPQKPLSELDSLEAKIAAALAFVPDG